MIQRDSEFEVFLGILRDLDVRSYLEVGCKFGGTFYRIGMAMPAGSKCVSVDLPRQPESGTYRSMHGVIRWLNSHERPCHAIWGDSISAKVISEARKHGPYDAVFIDADHSYRYVSRDWNNYGPMATKAVAFHDIAWRKSGVPRLWNEIKQDKRYIEIMHGREDEAAGIGIILL